MLGHGKLVLNVTPALEAIELAASTFYSSLRRSKVFHNKGVLKVVF